MSRDDRYIRRFTIVCGLIALGLLLFPADDAKPAADRVDRLPTRALEREARTVALHGGIRCHTVGVGAECATPYMRRLVRELVERRLRPYGSYALAWGLCVVGRESGFNPAAVSHTDDHGAGQLHRSDHRWVDYGRIAWQTDVSPTGWAGDPVYSVAVFVRLSRGGANRDPWTGGRYRC